MNIPYRTRRVIKRFGTVAFFVAVVLLIAWFCSVVWLERYIVYTRDGAELDLSLSSNDVVGEVAAPPSPGQEISIYYNEGENAIEMSNELVQLDGYYIDTNTLTNDIAGVWDLLEPLNKGTPIMIDLKGGYGSFYYSSTVPEAMASQSVSVASVDELIKHMREQGFYTIARISAFRDYNYGLHHVSSGLMHVNRMGLWPDEGGCYWLNPEDPQVISWLISLVNELKNMGFNEVVLTDFRFPGGDKYIYNGDKAAALASAAQRILDSCVTHSFTVSFGTTDATLQVPQGRSRLYLENVEPVNVGSRASIAGVDNHPVRLVFVAQTNDTRYNDYGVLRPITASEILEAQKAAQEENK